MQLLVLKILYLLFTTKGTSSIFTPTIFGVVDVFFAVSFLICDEDR